MQEILGVSLLLVWLNEWQAFRSPEGYGCQSRELSYKLNSRSLSLSWIMDVLFIVVKELRKCTHNAAHDSHGMCIGFKALVEVLDLLMYQHLIHDLLFKDLQL